MAAPELHDDAEALAASILEATDGRIVLGLPLGLGKPGRIANALYRRAEADSGISLDIFTALTLEPPSASSDMERRFVDPLNERLFSGYERLAYTKAIRDDALPKNVHVSEFFLQAGRWLGVGEMQRSYVSANYTHAASVILERGVNVIAQLVARSGEGASTRYSLSCNSDITLDLLPALEAVGRRHVLAGEVSSALPFMGGEAELPAARFDHILETPGVEPRLFGTPKTPVSDADHAIGIHAASLVKDGGTLQIGIGSLGDSVAAALVMRHEAPEIFAQTLARLCHGEVPKERHTRPFEKGLYAASEMFVDGFMELYRHGILKRKATDGALLHAGFFLGPEEFYRFLRDLPEDERALFQMRGISFVNELFGAEAQKRADRVKARFVNTAMMATLLGETVSDGLEDGIVVSGVGGQYNFVAQAFALEGARSLITLSSTRKSKGKRESRILWNYGHTTIPRHLRDVFVTEYGVAELRGRSDRDCVAAMLAIADEEFQGELAGKARKAGKIKGDYTLPQKHRDNTPDFISRALEPAKKAGWCGAFPFGTDFTPQEQRLMPALALLRESTATKVSTVRTVMAALMSGGSGDGHRPELERMDLESPQGFSQRLYRRLLVWALERTSPPKEP